MIAVREVASLVMAGYQVQGAASPLHLPAAAALVTFSSAPLLGTDAGTPDSVLSV